jgi:hypothetical protein
LGFEVVFDPLLPHGVRGMSAGRVIWIAAGQSPTRQQFAAGHEIGELSLRLAISGDVREAICQRFAAALLLPRAAFAADLMETAGSLPLLRRRWPHASALAIARRVTDVHPAACSTWRDGAPSRRWSSAAQLEGACSSEARAVDAAMRCGSSVVSSCRRFTMAWRLGDGHALSVAYIRQPIPV